MAQQFRLVKYYNLPRELYGNYMGYGYGSLIDMNAYECDMRIVACLNGIGYQKLVNRLFSTQK